MTKAQQIKAVIERASQKSEEVSWIKRFEGSRPAVPTQRTSSVQPKHETPKQR